MAAEEPESSSSARGRRADFALLVAAAMALVVVSIGVVMLLASTVPRAAHRVRSRAPTYQRAARAASRTALGLGFGAHVPG